MSLEDICALPVSQVATSDAVLLLWATTPKLDEAMRVIAAWGFRYRTAFVWVKDKVGTGYYVRMQHEHLLIATRGEMPVPKPTSLHASVVHAPRGAHSVKPAIFYEIIERLYPEYPKRELFLRGQPRPGWLGWGNQAELPSVRPYDEPTSEPPADGFELGELLGGGRTGR
jgi:N6-adenosine-specific RNA methylase IME4